MVINDGLTETMKKTILLAQQIAAGAQVFQQADGQYTLILNGLHRTVPTNEFILAADLLNEVESTICAPAGLVRPYNSFFLLDMRENLESALLERFNKKHIRVAYIIGGKDACAYWRCMQPAKFINELYGDEIVVDVTNGVSFESLYPYDIIIIQRALFGNERERVGYNTDDIITCIKRLKQAGKKIVYETDDSLDDLALDNQCFYVISPMEAKGIKWFIEESDAIFTTTKELGERLGQMNKTFVLPNSMDLELFTPVERGPRRDDYVFSLFAGSSSHEKDIQYIAKPLTTLIGRRDELGRKLNKDIVFGFLGYFPDLMRQFVEFKFPSQAPVKENLKAKIKSGKELEVLTVTARQDVRYIKGVPVEEYHEFLTYLTPDIVLCPLLPDHPFNDSKSNIKAIEGLAAGAAPVVSNVGPFRYIPDDCCERSNTPEQFCQAVQKLIIDEDKRKSIQAKGMEWVRENFDIRKNAILWVEAFRSIVGVQKEQANG